MARINLWTFRLPGLKERAQDIEPNLRYELDRFAAKTGSHVTFNKEAREAFLRFAMSPEARWPANFRDLNAAVTRMATLAAGGRIRAEDVVDETARLRESWRHACSPEGEAILKSVLDESALSALDRFDRVQLADVVRVCRESATLSAAGRTLFSESRKAKESPNDADRLRKYLARFGLDWSSVRGDGPA